MTDSERLTGYVKWFNSKSGYGFITICGEDRDIFVHYSNVKVDGLQYTYLVQGEYVEFDLVETTDNDKHTHKAVNITGIKGGPLMCKTRTLNRQEEDDRKPLRIIRPPRAPRANVAPNFEEVVDGEFKTVVRKRRV